MRPHVRIFYPSRSERDIRMQHPTPQLLQWLCVYVCMCVCVCVYVFKYVCKYVCMCVCIYVCMHACMCVYVCMHACMYVCVCVFVCTYVDCETMQKKNRNDLGITANRQSRIDKSEINCFIY